MVAATDYWPQEEGYIVEGSPVMMCKTDGTITEMSTIKITTGAAGYVSVDHSALVADSIGVALRACTVTGQFIPIAFGGIVKMLADSTIVVQQPIVNESTNSSKVEGYDPARNVGSDDMFFNGSSAWILGLALQNGVTDGDEILILLAPM